MTAKPNTSPLEHAEQVALFEWADSQTWDERLQWLYAIPNGGHRSKRTAAMLKAEGVKPGYPDIGLDVPRIQPDGKWLHGIRIELKRTSGGRTSPEQLAWHTWLRSQGLRVVVCKGWAVAAVELSEYLGGGHDLPY